jgi:hypothetical protein
MKDYSSWGERELIEELQKRDKEEEERKALTNAEQGYPLNN